MNSILLKSDRAYKNRSEDFPWRTGLLLAGVLIALCILSAATTVPFDPTIVGP